MARTRQRYLKLSKEELVDRLLVTEQAYTEQEKRCHQANDELLTLRLMVEEGLQIQALDEKTEGNQNLTDASQRLRAKNKELKAQLMGIESLETEIEELKKQNQYLLNKLIQLEGEERSNAKKNFAKARNQANSQPNIPDVEF